MPVKQNESQPTVREIMMEFARKTGLSPASGAPRRYLWTDAFAVCNFLGLYLNWVMLATSLAPDGFLEL